MGDRTCFLKVAHRVSREGVESPAYKKAPGCTGAKSQYCSAHSRRNVARAKIAATAIYLSIEGEMRICMKNNQIVF